MPQDDKYKKFSGDSSTFTKKVHESKNTPQQKTKLNKLATGKQVGEYIHSGNNRFHRSDSTMIPEPVPPQMQRHFDSTMQANKIYGNNQLYNKQQPPPPPPNMIDSVFRAAMPAITKNIQTGWKNKTTGRLVCTADDKCKVHETNPDIASSANQGMPQVDRQMGIDKNHPTSSQFIVDGNRVRTGSDGGLHHAGVSWVNNGAWTENPAMYHDMSPGGKSYNANAASPGNHIMNQIEQGKLTPADAYSAFKNTPGLTSNIDSTQFVNSFEPITRTDTLEPAREKELSQAQMNEWRKSGREKSFKARGGSIQGFKSQDDMYNAFPQMKGMSKLSKSVYDKLKK